MWNKWEKGKKKYKRKEIPINTQRNLAWFVERIGNVVSMGYTNHFIVDYEDANDLYLMQFRTKIKFN
jgi:hypothetical protein